MPRPHIVTVESEDGRLMDVEYTPKIIQERHPLVSRKDRLKIKNLGERAANIRYLESKGLLVEDYNGQLAVRKPDELHYKVVDEAGFDIQDPADVVGDVASMLGMGVGAFVGAPGGLPGAAAGAAGGAAAVQGMKNVLGTFMGLQPTPGEAAGAMVREGALGATAEVGGRAIAPIGRAIAKPIGKAISAVGKKIGPKPLPKNLVSEAQEANIKRFFNEVDPKKPSDVVWRRVPDSARKPGRLDRQAFQTQPDVPPKTVAELAEQLKDIPVGRRRVAEEIVSRGAASGSRYDVGSPANLAVKEAKAAIDAIDPALPEAYLQRRLRAIAGEFGAKVTGKTTAEDVLSAVGRAAREATSTARKKVWSQEKGLIDLLEKSGGPTAVRRFQDDLAKSAVDPNVPLSQVRAEIRKDIIERIAKLQPGYHGGTGSATKPGLTPLIPSKGGAAWKTLQTSSIKGLSQGGRRMDPTKLTARQRVGSALFRTGLGLGMKEASIRRGFGTLGRTVAGGGKYGAAAGRLAGLGALYSVGGFTGLATAAAVRYGSRGVSSFGKKLLRDSSASYMRRMLMSPNTPPMVKKLAEEAIKALQTGGIDKYRIAVWIALKNAEFRKYAVESGLIQEDDQR